MFSYPLFFLLSLGQIGRLSFLNQAANINLFDLYLAGVVIWLMVRYRFKPLSQSFRNLKFLYFFVFWLAITLVISLKGFSAEENIIASSYLLRVVIYFVFSIYLSYVLVKEKLLRQRLNKGMLFFSITTVFLSVLQFFLYPNLRNLSYLGWDPHQGRIFGTFFDVSAAAAIFGLTLLYFVFHKVGLKPFLRFCLLTIYGILGLLTYSRGFYISILLTSGLCLVVSRQYKTLFAVLACFILALFILPRQFGEGTNLLRTFSIESRLNDEKEALRITMEKPFFGIGYNHLRYVRVAKERMQDQPESHAGASFHSSFLIISATSGIVGLILFVLALVQLASVSAITKYYVIFLSIFSLFDNVLLYPVVMVLFLSMLAGEISKSKKSIFRT